LATYERRGRRPAIVRQLSRPGWRWRPDRAAGAVHDAYYWRKAAAFFAIHLQ